MWNCFSQFCFSRLQGESGLRRMRGVTHLKRVNLGGLRMKPFCEMLINILVVNVLFYHRRIKVDCFVGNRRREGAKMFNFFAILLFAFETRSNLFTTSEANVYNIDCYLVLWVTQNIIFLPSMKSDKNGPNEKMCKRILATKKKTCKPRLIKIGFAFSQDYTTSL